MGPDGEDAVLLLVDAAAGVGNGDDVIEFLGDVGWDYDVVPHGFQGLMSEQGVGPPGGLVGFFQVGVVLHAEVVYTEGQELPVESCLSDVDGWFVLGVSADLGVGGSEAGSVGAGMDGVSSWLVLVLVGGRLGGQEVFGEAERLPGDKSVGDEA